MSKLLQLFFERRGIPQAELAEMARVGTLNLKDVDAMCARLHDARLNGRRVSVFTDFDMDGIMSGVIGYAGLSELGFLTGLVPSRPTEGYGMHKSDVDYIMDSFPDTSVILTGDVGIGESESVAYAASLGLEVLVTDHHAGTPPKMASVCVDPELSDPGWFRGICGAHVLYLVLRRYAELYCGYDMVKQIDRLRVFAGIATVSDSMPVVHENRGIIMDAVAIMRMLWSNGDQAVVNLIPGCNVYRRAMLGVYVMCQVLHEMNKLEDADSINETLFGFYLAPMFNSVKRMDEDLDKAYSVFFKGKDAAMTAMRDLFALNDRRKTVVKMYETELFSKGSSIPQPLAPYIYETTAPHGLRGLLAQKAMERGGCPAIVVAREADGSWTGSGRSPGWFQFLSETAGLKGVHPAGHQEAFGIHVDSNAALEDLFRKLDGVTKSKQYDGIVTEVQPEIRISTFDPSADCELDTDELMDFLRELDGYRPFGNAFEAPVTQMEFYPGDARWYMFGENNAHVKAILPLGVAVVWFNCGDKFPVSNGRPDVSRMDRVIRAVGTLDLNRYGGRQSIQLMVR